MDPAVTPSAAPREPHTVASTANPPASTPQPRAWYRRPVAWVAAGVLAAAAIALGLVLARSGGSNDPPQNVSAGRNAALAVFDAWQEGRLDEVSAKQLSVAARRALETMPIEPVAPVPPAADECYGSSGDVDCSFTYPGLSLSLDFHVLEYSTGLRLADIQCYNDTTGNLVEGGIAACAQIVESS